MQNPIFETAFDTYSVQKLLGEGGAGRVFQVANRAGEAFALKLLAPERITQDRLKRFKNELDFCLRQSHERIIRVVDSGVVVAGNARAPFYVMRLYPKTLRTALATLRAAEKLNLFSQILDGVEAAHLSGVWHRDLKPENLLVSEDHRDLVVADFGIAHFEEESIFTAVETGVAARMANFQYSAPEQRVRGSTVDRRADLFALGLILAEMFTGEVPQGAGYKRIGASAPEYAYLDEIVDMMIQQQADRRVQSIDEVKKLLIGRKLSFVALQRLDEMKRQVVPVSSPVQFEPLKIVNFDYQNRNLTLQLSGNAPPGWAQEFQNPRGGHSALWGYGPERFGISGSKISIGVEDDERFIQQIIDHAKDYVVAANRGYQLQLNERATHEERERRHALEKATAEAELRKNILSRIKL